MAPLQSRNGILPPEEPRWLLYGRGGILPPEEPRWLPYGSGGILPPEEPRWLLYGSGGILPPQEPRWLLYGRGGILPPEEPRWLLYMVEAASCRPLSLPYVSVKTTSFSQRRKDSLSLYCLNSSVSSLRSAVITR